MTLALWLILAVPAAAGSADKIPTPAQRTAGL